MAPRRDPAEGTHCAGDSEPNAARCAWCRTDRIVQPDVARSAPGLAGPELTSKSADGSFRRRKMIFIRPKVISRRPKMISRRPKMISRRPKMILMSVVEFISRVQPATRGLLDLERAARDIERRHRGLSPAVGSTPREIDRVAFLTALVKPRRTDARRRPGAEPRRQR